MKTNIILWILLGLVIVGGGFYGLTSQAAYDLAPNEELELRIPHMASYRCEPLSGDATSPRVPLEVGGNWISQSSVGVYSNTVTDIQIEVPRDFWDDAFRDVRVKWYVCDVGGSCGSAQYDPITDPGTGVEVFNYPGSVYLQTQSVRIFLEQKKIFRDWEPLGGSTLVYSVIPWGIRLYSTTQDPAGSVICSTSCNLDCPDIEDIGYRLIWEDKLLATSINKLGFDSATNTAPYLEFWQDVEYDAGAHGGATIYDADTNTFCFAGLVYDAGRLEMESGKVYIYPETRSGGTRELCCPGAVVATLHSDRVCNDNYEWDLFTDDNTCISDINCPDEGDSICRNRELSAGYRCVDKDDNNIGTCRLESSRLVECCSSSDCGAQTCDTRTYTCVGGPDQYCGDGIKQSNEECDDGNNAGGDGCNSVCQIEVPATCGDGKVDAGEECDDGNLRSDDGCSEACQKEGIGGISKELWTIIGTIGGGVMLIFMAMTYIPDKKTAMLVSFGLLIAVIVAVVAIMGAFSMAEQDLSLRVLACSEPKNWWEKIPIVGLFGCNGRLDAIVGLVGAIVLTIAAFIWLPSLFTANPYLLIIPAILGYAVSIFTANIILDSWYMIVAALVAMYVFKATIDK